jgi:hypothetical protein
MRQNSLYKNVHFLTAYCFRNKDFKVLYWVRAMAEAVSRWCPTTEAQPRSRVSPCGTCGGQSSTRTGVSPEYFGFPLSVAFHRCSITWKNAKKKIIIFIVGLYKKPKGCGASVASAAGPLPTNKVLYIDLTKYK